MNRVRDVVEARPFRHLIAVVLTALGISTLACGAQPTGPDVRSVGQPTAEPYFVARTRDLLELLYQHPAKNRELSWYVKGINMYPQSPISARGLQVLRNEASAFDRTTRDRALRCGTPTNLPEQYQVLVLDLIGAGAGSIPVPVFLGPDVDELNYIEVALHRPGVPLVVLVRGYNGMALRLETSLETDLAAVHLQTYYPSLVLGVPASKVSQTYFPGSDRKSATTARCEYREIKAEDIVARLGLQPVETELLRAQNNEYRLIDARVAITRREPRLGTFLDLAMPVPRQYGVAVLADKGYLRPTLATRKKASGTQVLEVLKPFRLPAGVSGSTFVVPRGGAVPLGDFRSATLIQER
jgi:hypothetical protein